MNKNYCIYILSIVVITAIFGCSNNRSSPSITRTYTNLLHEIDGPYIYDKKDSLLVITVEKDTDSSFYIQNKILKKINHQTFKCYVNNSEKDSFLFTLKKSYEIPKAVYEAPEKLFATSDIEGNFNAFYSMLVGNKIMDENYRWIFGNGHLVIAGDMVDRGNNAWPCLWLLYKLEQEAEKAGGKVHYILGNHDVMNMHANLKYVKKRYIKLAKILSGKENEQEAYLYLLSNTNEIAKWIASKNTIEKIGNSIYVHGGISEEVVDANLTIDNINNIVRENIRKNLTNYPEENEYNNLVFSRFGPLWYRGLVKDQDEHYKKINVHSLNQILKFYDADRIVVGHTIVDKEVTSDFEGKVIRIDLIHPGEKFTGISQGLLIENGKYFKVNDRGERFELEFNGSEN